MQKQMRNTLSRQSIGSLLTGIALICLQLWAPQAAQAIDKTKPALSETLELWDQNPIVISKHVSVVAKKWWTIDYDEQKKILTCKKGELVLEYRITKQGKTRYLGGYTPWERDLWSIVLPEYPFELIENRERRNTGKLLTEEYPELEEAVLNETLTIAPKKWWKMTKGEIADGSVYYFTNRKEKKFLQFWSIGAEQGVFYRMGNAPETLPYERVNKKDDYDIMLGEQKLRVNGKWSVKELSNEIIRFACNEREVSYQREMIATEYGQVLKLSLHFPEDIDWITQDAIIDTFGHPLFNN